MTGLEQRYRRLLRLLPDAYLERWEEEMVDTFLLTAMPAEPDTDHAQLVAAFGRPSVAETWSVLCLAVRLRLGAGQSTGRAAAYGAALRLTGLIGLLLLAATTGISVVTVIVAVRHRGEFGYGQLDRWSWLWIFACLLWAAAYLAIIAGSRRPGRRLAVLALVLAAPPVWRLVSADWSTWNYTLGTAVYLVLPALVPVVALVAFHADAPPLHPRPWLIALPVAMVVSGALSLVGVVFPLAVFDLPAIDEALLLAIIGGYLLARRTRRIEPGAQWPLALGILTAVALTVRAATLGGYAGYLPWQPLFTVAVTEGVLLFGALVVLIPLVRRDLAALPVPAP
jgi:hypothetical protein